MGADRPTPATARHTTWDPSGVTGMGSRRVMTVVYLLYPDGVSGPQLGPKWDTDMGYHGVETVTGSVFHMVSLWYTAGKFDG